jgi:tRNA pseudouridine13 synthase
MKLKVKPGDFLVEEQADFPLSDRRDSHAVFRLSKTSWDTFDLVDLLARRLRVQRADICVGGIKDRHGSTVQLVSVRGLRGAPRSLAEKNFTLEFAGYAGQPITAAEIRGNRFTLVLRDMSRAEVDTHLAGAAHVARDGLPNYFDEQRFGSARHKAGFMGKEIFLGRREQALRLYFTPSKHDDQKTRKLKKCAIENWGRWGACAGLGFGEYGRVLAYLAAHPRAHHAALELIDRRLLLLAVNAYQSFLFNAVLARWTAALAARRSFEVRELAYGHGRFVFPTSLPEGLPQELAKTLLPVPGYDSSLPDPAVRRIVEEVLAEESVSLSDLRVRQMRRLSAHGVERAAFVRPEDLSVSAAEEDELYPGRFKLSLAFFLPRGSYATLVVKRMGVR